MVASALEVDLARKTCLGRAAPSLLSGAAACSRRSAAVLLSVVALAGGSESLQCAVLPTEHRKGRLLCAAAVRNCCVQLLPLPSTSSSNSSIAGTIASSRAHGCSNSTPTSMES